MGREARAKRERAADRIRIISAYANEAGPIFRHYFTPDCCLNGTRVALEAMKHFGVEARPLTTQVMLFNKLFWERIQAKGEMPDEEECQAWVREGGWSIGIRGQSTGRPGWPYHLVAIADSFLIDSSMRQFNRPERNIEVPDLSLSKATPDFLAGRLPLVLSSASGLVISYNPEPSNLSYQACPGFEQHDLNMKVADLVIDAMRTKLNWR
jgi:hypothetical protein